MTLADADEIVFLDFEFQSESGDRPKPVCFVARELRSGRLVRQWVEGEPVPPEPPFAHGPRCITVAYFNPAEWGCYFALGWRLPALTLDAFAEFRVRTNGLNTGGRSLVAALQWYKLDAMDAMYKAAMRKRILAGGPYSAEEREAILTYCQGDVDPLVLLLDRMFTPQDNLVLALCRGEFMKAVAGMEWAGVPVDRELYVRMVEHWPELQELAIARVNASIPVYEGRSFRRARFETWLQDHGLYDRWPRTADDSVALDDDTFHEQAALHPELEPLRQVRQMLGQLKKPGLVVGIDGRNRCMLSPFHTVTGRNQPSTVEFIFACPSWMRGLIRPESNTALAYCDWKAQEFGIAAVLSGDGNMQTAYQTGDCYLAFAKLAGAVPADATAKTYPAERELFKRTTLGTQYLISAAGLAYQLEITLPEAENLLDHHHRLFPQFWEWSDSVCDYGQLYGELTATFGWRMQLGPGQRIRTLRNFPMQSNGAEMLRLGAVYAQAEGMRLVATVHDALLVEAPAAEIQLRLP